MHNTGSMKWLPLFQIEYLINKAEKKNVHRWLRWPWYQYWYILPIIVKLKKNIFNAYQLYLLYCSGFICPSPVSACLFRTYSNCLIDTKTHDTQWFTHQWSLDSLPNCVRASSAYVPSVSWAWSAFYCSSIRFENQSQHLIHFSHNKMGKPRGVPWQEDLTSHRVTECASAPGFIQVNNVR